MKRTTVNIAAVLTALIVGLTINNACAEKIDSENPEEVPMTVGFFVEDGLLFGPDGKVYNKLKSYNGSVRYDSLVVDEANISESSAYDSKGRLISKNCRNSRGDFSVNINVSYSYSGSTMKEKISWSNSGGDSGTYTNTYTYHSLEQ